MEQTPPELYADIVNKGIYLAGGGALLRGLDKRLTDKLNIPFHIAEDPLRAVARGTGIPDQVNPLGCERNYKTDIKISFYYNFYFVGSPLLFSDSFTQ